MSRPRPARGNAPAAARGGRPGVFVSTPKSDIYVVLLSIALGSMVLGSLLLVLILSRYDFKLKVSSLSPPSQASTLTLLEKSETVLL